MTNPFPSPFETILPHFQQLEEMIAARSAKPVEEITKGIRSYCTADACMRVQHMISETIKSEYFGQICTGEELSKHPTGEKEFFSICEEIVSSGSLGIITAKLKTRENAKAYLSNLIAFCAKELTSEKFVAQQITHYFQLRGIIAPQKRD